MLQKARNPFKKRIRHLTSKILQWYEDNIIPRHHASNLHWISSLHPRCRIKSAGMRIRRNRCLLWTSRVSMARIDANDAVE